MPTIRTGYTARPQLIAYHKRTQRFAILVCHRRMGKTVGCINDVIDYVMRCQLPSPRGAYIAPFYKQAKDVAWEYAKQYTRAIPGMTANEAELRIDLPGDRRVRLYGADNPDALRGVYFDTAVLDEFANMRPRFLPEVIRPALSDRNGKLTIIGTPCGHNEFYDLWQAAQGNPDWYSMMARASETGIISASELTDARKMMTEAQFAQEYECSFEAAIEGSYYGTLLETAQREGRITDLPVNPGLPVYTAWDLGVGDDTAIWFAQRVGGWLHVIDHYATNGQAASHYVDVLRRKPYTYARHFLPHDADNREWSNGKSRLDTLKALGLENIKVLPRIPVDDGINAVRLLLPTCRFDATRCAHGLESLRQYRRDYDENRRTFRPTPLHDWTSHDADALRYLATGLEPEAAVTPDIPRYSGRRRFQQVNTGGSGWAA